MPGDFALPGCIAAAASDDWLTYASAIANNIENFQTPYTWMKLSPELDNALLTNIYNMANLSLP